MATPNVEARKPFAAALRCPACVPHLLKSKRLQATFVH